MRIYTHHHLHSYSFILILKFTLPFLKRTVNIHPQSIKEIKFQDNNSNIAAQARIKRNLSNFFRQRIHQILASYFAVFLSLFIDSCCCIHCINSLIYINRYMHTYLHMSTLLLLRLQQTSLLSVPHHAIERHSTAQQQWQERN